MRAIDLWLSSNAQPRVAADLALAEYLLQQEYRVAAEGFGAVDGLSAGDTPAAFEPIIVVPRFVQDIIAAQERGASDRAPNLTIGQWLHAQPPAVQRRERLRALRKLGLAVF